MIARLDSRDPDSRNRGSRRTERVVAIGRQRRRGSFTVRETVNDPASGSAETRGDADDDFRLALLIANHGDATGAEAAYRRADARGHAAAAGNLGVLLEARGRVVEAEEAYRRGEERGDRCATFNLAAMLTDQGRLSEAQEAYRRVTAVGEDRLATMAATALIDLSRLRIPPPDDVHRARAVRRRRGLVAFGLATVMLGLFAALAANDRDSTNPPDGTHANMLGGRGVIPDPARPRSGSPPVAPIPRRTLVAARTRTSHQARLQRSHRVAHHGLGAAGSGHSRQSAVRSTANGGRPTMAATRERIPRRRLESGSRRGRGTARVRSTPQSGISPVGRTGSRGGTRRSAGGAPRGGGAGAVHISGAGSTASVGGGGATVSAGGGGATVSVGGGRATVSVGVGAATVSVGGGGATVSVGGGGGTVSVGGG
jgi:hypothetical protein